MQKLEIFDILFLSPCEANQGAIRRIFCLEKKVQNWVCVVIEFIQKIVPVNPWKIAPVERLKDIEVFASFQLF